MGMQCDSETAGGWTLSRSVPLPDYPGIKWWTAKTSNNACGWYRGRMIVIFPKKGEEGLYSYVLFLQAPNSDDLVSPIFGGWPHDDTTAAAWRAVQHVDELSGLHT